MDWGKAKHIMIIAFFVLNIFLGYQLFNQYLGGSSSPSGLLVPSSFEDYLKQRDITLETTIPQDTFVLSYLSARYSDIASILPTYPPREVVKEKHKILVRFWPPIPFSNPGEQLDMLKNIESYIPYIKEYTLETKLSSNGVYRFTQLINNYPAFNASLEVVFENQQVKGYRHSHIEVMNKGLERKMISPVTALRILIDRGYVRSGENISAVTLGYYGKPLTGEIQVLVPVWRVVHNEKVDYVNGINGAFEGSSSLEKSSKILNNNG